MKRPTLRPCAALLAFALGNFGCYGSMSASGSVYQWNSGVGGKWPRTLLFGAFWIIPVYELTVLGDILIFNTIEFWGGGKVFSGGWRSGGGSADALDPSKPVFVHSERPYELRRVEDGKIEVIRDGQLIALAERGETGELVITDPNTGETRRFSEEALLALREGSAGEEAGGAGVGEAR